MIHPEAASFAGAVSGKLREVLGEDLHAAYQSGSVALGGYAPGQSDVDLFVPCRHSLEAEEMQLVAQTISGEAAGCPTRG